MLRLARISGRNANRNLTQPSSKAPVEDTHIGGLVDLPDPLRNGTYRAPHLPHNARLADAARFRASGRAHVAGYVRFRVGQVDVVLSASESAVKHSGCSQYVSMFRVLTALRLGEQRSSVRIKAGSRRVLASTT
jgi:hypothetical protein